MGSHFPELVICIFPFTLVVLAFWIWMLIDCIINEPSEGNDKIVWMLVIILTNWIGALIYFFVRQPTRKNIWTLR